jgi:hypothetical protein
MRQRMFRRPGGPDYEAIVDELAIRRLSVPPAVMKKSLYHVATLVNDNPKITVRVLPADARVEGYATPRTSFYIYTFADPGDPTVVVADTFTAELFLTEPAEVAPHEVLFDRLLKASLSAQESLDLIVEAASRLSDE